MNRLLVNCHRYETRAALVENNTPIEFYLDRSNDQGLVGNVYKGRVQRVLPGMQAAFVDVGLDRSAFLYVTDVSPTPDRGDGDELDEPHDHKPAGAKKIEELLTEGQEILVQVSKDPIGTKGARLTSNISLPGRYLVYMPLVEHIGVSRRIENEKERLRLRDFISEHKQPNSGFIVRTVCEGESLAKLKLDMDYLVALWAKLTKKEAKTKAPSLIHKELSIPLRLVRDVLTDEIDELIIDTHPEYKEILSFLQVFNPSLKKKIKFYQGAIPLFDKYGIEVELERSLSRKVWLKSGGYIAIDQTEALVSIDINTGKYVGTTTQSETIVKTNLEAVKEIAYQLRLRNIGGIIILDFIDMPSEHDRDLVYTTLLELLKHDKAKTKVLRFSELGIIEMSRKRVRENLKNILTEHCFYCHGNGYLKSQKTVAYEVFRTIEKHLLTSPQRGQFAIHANKSVVDYIYHYEKEYIDSLESQYNAGIVFKSDEHCHLEQYRIIQA